MNTFKKSFLILGAAALIGSQSAFAFAPKETPAYFNGPTVSNVESTSATVSLSPQVLGGMTDEEKSQVYFEYIETHMVCIMIYPTPEHCLPKKTELGKTNVTLTNLKPNTSYTIKYKKDNTIRCITTPCPENGFESQSVEFITKNSSAATTTPATPAKLTIHKNLMLGSRGAQVTVLQTILRTHGYLRSEPTGYFGLVTMAAVSEFQRANQIAPIGIVGPLTRKALNELVTPTVKEETFEGTITAFSTACFADGECSVTVDGKKVVTTIGWSQKVVGKVTGIPDFGSIESKIGAKAKVYAKKTEDGNYTLYGKEEYYIEVK